MDRLRVLQGDGVGAVQDDPGPRCRFVDLEQELLLLFFYSFALAGQAEYDVMRKSSSHNNFEQLIEVSKSDCEATERRAIAVKSWIAHGLRLLVVISGAALVFVGPVSAGGLERGELEFRSKCAACHGLDAKGDGPFATQIITAPADLTQLAKRNGGIFPEAAVKETIDGIKDVAAHGPRDMPVWGIRYRVGRGEKTRIEALVDYLRRIQQSPRLVLGRSTSWEPR
jgi:mono/diheme cytochrome c family protein